MQIFENDLNSLHTLKLDLSMRLEEKSIIASHPVYQYLFEAYGLNIHNVNIEPGEMPTEEQWKELDHLMDHHPSHIMIWENEPMAEIHSKLLDKGIKVIVFNPCGNQPAENEFIEQMKKNI